MSDNYDKIDRFLRNNLDDTDYAEYSAALDDIARFGPRPAAEPGPVPEGWLAWSQLWRANHRHTMQELLDLHEECAGNWWAIARRVEEGVLAKIEYRAAEPIQSGSAGEVASDDFGKYVALAERCGAEVGRHEGQMVWMKFHRQSSVEAFVTGIAMLAALSRQAPAAPAEAVTRVPPPYCETLAECADDMARESSAPTPSDPQALLGWTRYEKARKLNPAQWAELHQRNLRGGNFDDMIDALPVTTQPVQQDTSHLPRFVVNGVYQNGRHFSRRFDSAADRDDWLEAEGFENMAEFKCSEEPK